MIILYQVVLLVTIVISFLGVMGETKNKDLQEKMLTTFLACLVAFIVSVLWL